MEESELLKKRREKIDSLKADGIDLYPNDVRVGQTTASVRERFGQMTPEELENVTERFTLAGRLMAVRDFGKGAFISIQDRTGRLQAFLRKNQIGDKAFSLFKRLDIGDIVWISGRVFKTKTGELTIDVEENGIRLLAKSLHPLPEKWHGLTDVEIRYRQRHLDLIVNPEVRKVFQTRSRIISLIRRFMEERDFLEVETPMMQPKAGGAVARPFQDLSQRPGNEPLPPDRPRTLPETADHRRDGAGLRDQPELQERGDLHLPQPRIHDDGVLPGLCHLRGPDDHDGGAHHVRRGKSVRNAYRSAIRETRST